MKRKTIRIVVLVISIFSTAQLYAQNKSNEEMAKSLSENMKQNLALNDDQYEKAYTINLAFVNKATQVRNSGGGRLAQMRKLKDADGERDKMLKGVLTDEQYKKYKEQKVENRKKMKKRMKDRNDK